MLEGVNLNWNVHIGIVIVVHVLQTFEMGTEGEASVNDIGQNRDEATTSTAAVNLILEGMSRMQEELLSIQRGQEEAAELSERNVRKENYTFVTDCNRMPSDRSATADGFARAVSLRAAKDKTQIQCTALNTYTQRCIIQPFSAYADKEAL